MAGKLDANQVIKLAHNERAKALKTTTAVLSPSDSFTRPANTTAYASGDLVANSTTAGQVEPLEFTVSDVQGSCVVRRARIRKSGTGVSGADFRLHLFSAAPSTITNGDNGAYSVSGSADYLGSLDVSVDEVFTDGAAGIGDPTKGVDINIKLPSGQIVYGFLEADGTYTPASAEVFVITLELV